jgi:hypothetical protein
MYSWIEIELQGVQQELQSKRAVSTTPLSIITLEVGDEPSQLHQIIDSVEAQLLKAHDEANKSTQALTQVQGVLVEQHSAAEQEKSALQAKWNGEKAQLQQGKEQLLVEELEVKEAVNKALLSVTVIEVKTEERIPQQVAQIADVIQKLQQHIADLELQEVLETP